MANNNNINLQLDPRGFFSTNNNNHFPINKPELSRADQVVSHITSSLFLNSIPNSNYKNFLLESLSRSVKRLPSDQGVFPEKRGRIQERFPEVVLCKLKDTAILCLISIMFTFQYKTT